MLTEHYLFHVPGVTSESRLKFVDSKDVHVSEFIWHLTRKCLKTMYLMGSFRQALFIPHRALINCSDPRSKACAHY